MKKFEGNLLSKGIAKGKLKIIEVNSKNCDYSFEDFEKAVDELKVKYEKYEDDYLMQSRALMLEDEEFLNFIKDKFDKTKNIFKSLDAYYDYAKELFSQLDDDYLKERIHDIKDLVESVKLKISNEDIELGENTILYMEDMSASLFIENRDKIVGLLTKKGSYSSHVAILARTFKIPMLTNIDVENNLDGEEIYLDALEENSFYVEPDDEFIKKFKEKEISYNKMVKELEEFKNKKIIYKNNEIKFKANIGSVEESEIIEEIDGIGLLRTEFILFDREKAPDYKEQKEIYQTISNNLGKKEIVLRTFDIGGDKQIDYLKLPKEKNPFLGKRGVRLYEDEKVHKLVEDQIESLFELSKEGHNFKIMIPMVSNNREVNRFFEEFIKPKQEKYNIKIPFGIMVETPSMALSFDKNTNIDFISVGTNDLTQYTLAVDRTNDEISNLYDYFDEGVMELIDIIIKKAINKRIDVSFCGESAAIPEMAKLLIGKGVKTLSMSYSNIPEVKKYLYHNL
ncbi:putative PEP-binding protein [Geotoga petraea]|uniref:Phosphoenolpyruvate--protein phosphotransferase n=1 Tax=Geotoga petraea TaxID=28234 RepID=A0A4Z0W6G0_9BACT|nr:putative PEP-binding protein [Geotoga petraea]TGG88664.1 phosphoenolpyruvate--protein phosphotransferase [Geotoga petraea]